jgi:predicted nucleic acid-binding protein
LENRRILIDTSVLIEYFRKKRKDLTLLYKLSIDYKLYTSSICYFEYKLGSVDEAFEKKLFSNITTSTAMSNQMALATLNLNHFDRIDRLEILTSA